MIVEVKTDELNKCQCGFKPDHYTIGYSRTPYNVYCPVCKKGTNMAKCYVTDHQENLIDYWNSHIAPMKMDEFGKEVKDYIKEREQQMRSNEYTVYNYFWVKGEGQVLVASCWR